MKSAITAFSLCATLLVGLAQADDHGNQTKTQFVGRLSAGGGDGTAWLIEPSAELRLPQFGSLKTDSRFEFLVFKPSLKSSIGMGTTPNPRPATIRYTPPPLFRGQTHHELVVGSLLSASFEKGSLRIGTVGADCHVVTLPGVGLRQPFVFRAGGVGAEGSISAPLTEDGDVSTTWTVEGDLGVLLGPSEITPHAGELGAKAFATSALVDFKWGLEAAIDWDGVMRIVDRIDYRLMAEKDGSYATIENQFSCERIGDTGLGIVASFKQSMASDHKSKENPSPSQRIFLLGVRWDSDLGN